MNLLSDYELAVVARKHSEDMALENYFSHESPVTGNLADRLKEAEIEHRKARRKYCFQLCGCNRSGPWLA